MSGLLIIGGIALGIGLFGLGLFIGMWWGARSELQVLAGREKPRKSHEEIWQELVEWEREADRSKPFGESPNGTTGSVVLPK